VARRANTPFRSQKDTNWEARLARAAFIRWPGRIKAGSVLNAHVPPGHAADAAGGGRRSGHQPESC